MVAGTVSRLTVLALVPTNEASRPVRPHAPRLTTLLRAFLCRRGILCGRRGRLLRVVNRLALRRLHVADELLQAHDRALQRLDLPVGGVEFLLMVRGEFCDRLLQEVDIALQATGPPFHGLFDGAD